MHQRQENYKGPDGSIQDTQRHIPTTGFESYTDVGRDRVFHTTPKPSITRAEEAKFGNFCSLVADKVKEFESAAMSASQAVPDYEAPSYDERQPLHTPPMNTEEMIGCGEYSQQQHYEAASEDDRQENGQTMTYEDSGNTTWHTIDNAEQLDEDGDPEFPFPLL